MQIIWDEEKNKLLKSTRDICFEDIESAILNDKVLDIVPHHNTIKYPNQELLIVEFANYVYYVPFVMDEEKLMLKTIIPSRKLTKKYRKD